MEESVSLGSAVRALDSQDMSTAPGKGITKLAAELWCRLGVAGFVGMQNAHTVDGSWHFVPRSRRKAWEGKWCGTWLGSL